jgi:hypothetical protein
MSSSCCKTTIVIENPPSKNINVIVNDALPTFHLINSYINNLSSNLQKFEDASNNIIANSAAYFNFEEVDEVNFIQTLTADFLETFHEVNIMQPLTSHWQSVTDYIKGGIIDAGFI